MTTEAVIRFQNVSKNFSQRVIFRNLNLQISPGSFTSLVGRSGCGKSTALRMIAGLEKTSAGELKVSPSEEKNLSYVFQESQLLPWKTVFENVRLPLEVGPTGKNIPQAEKDEKVISALKKVHLESFEQQFPHQLSGGMKMRVSLARALVNSPKLLLMDEPFGALDEVTRFEMQNQLLELWAKEQMTVVFVTHSLNEAVYLSQRVVLLNGDNASAWSDLPIPLPLPRSENLRTSSELNLVVRDLSERLRG